MTVTTNERGQQNMWALNHECISQRPTLSVMVMRLMQNVQKN